jgi:hypothetical protein
MHQPAAHHTTVCRSVRNNRNRQGLMKLQLWTNVNGQADECLGEIDVDDQEWNDAQGCSGDALELIQALASEMGSEAL